jgi:hypothetical protein
MENVPLAIGIAAVAVAGFWLLKKLLKLALWGALLGAAAWIWYFTIR